MTEQDAAKGWMSQPTELEDMTQVEQLLCPRFIVEQTKEDGTKKLRAIDNLSWGAKSAMDASLQERPSKRMRKSVSVNGHVSVNEKLKHHTLDDFVQLLRAFYRSVGCLPAMLKADIDAAFRRIPIAADSRWACGVAFASGDKVYIAQHFSCPFGAVGSVHGWERIGAAILHIARWWVVVQCDR